MITLKPLPAYWAVAARLADLRRDSTARNTVLVFANNLVTAVGGMLFLFLMTRRVDPGTVGVVTAGTAMIILLAGISQMGLGMGIIRYSVALGPRRAARLRGIFAFVAVAALLVGALFWALAARLAPGLQPAIATLPDAAPFIGACVGWTLTVQYDNYLMSRRCMALLLLKSALMAGSRPLLLVLLVQPSTAQLIGITGLSALLGIVGVAPLVPRYTVTALEAAEAPVSTRRLLSFSFWNYLSGLAGTLPALVMPTIVVSSIGGTQAAAYYMAWTLFSVLLFVPSAFSWALFAEQSAQAGSPARRATGASRWAGVLMLVLPVLFVPAGLLVLALLGASYLAYGWPALLLLAGGFWPYYRSQLLMIELRMGGAQWPLTLASLVSHLAIIGVSLPLLAVLGTAGAALAWSAGQGLLLGLLAWSARARQRQGEA